MHVYAEESIPSNQCTVFSRESQFHHIKQYFVTRAERLTDLGTTTYFATYTKQLKRLWAIREIIFAKYSAEKIDKTRPNAQLFDDQSVAYATDSLSQGGWHGWRQSRGARPERQAPEVP